MPIVLLVLLGATSDLGEFFPTDCPSLIQAAHLGEQDAVAKALKAGADINSRCGEDNDVTALAEATLYNRATVVQQLLENGADPELSNVFGLSPLHIAAQSGHAEVVRLLLYHGARVNARDVGDNTPLHLASRGPSSPNCDTTDWSCRWMLATRGDGHLQVVASLVVAGADVNARDEHARTPLMAAAENGNAEIVQVLLNHGADPSLQSKRGESAMSLAQALWHTAVVELLGSISAPDR